MTDGLFHNKSQTRTYTSLRCNTTLQKYLCPLVLSSLCPLVLLTFYPFVLLSHGPFVLVSFCPFVLLSHGPFVLVREALFPECDEISSSSSINLFAKRRLIAVFVILGVYPWLGSTISHHASVVKTVLPAVTSLFLWPAPPRPSWRCCRYRYRRLGTRSGSHPPWWPPWKSSRHPWRTSVPSVHGQNVNTSRQFTNSPPQHQGRPTYHPKTHIGRIENFGKENYLCFNIHQNPPICSKTIPKAPKRS